MRIYKWFCLIVGSCCLLMRGGVCLALTPDLSSLTSVPALTAKTPSAKKIEQARSKTRPYLFAVNAPLKATLASGLWDRLDTGTWRWRLRVGSPGAKSLSLEFSRFHLPAGAELWFYDARGALVQGPYTPANHTPEGKLWTAMILGSRGVIELHVPYALRDQVELELTSLKYGFRGLGSADAGETKSAGPPGPGTSDGCEIDVVCPQGQPWPNEIRSVALISINGEGFCSGQMLNNTAQNNDPLFVTANHCGIGQNHCGQNQTDFCSPSSVVFYWNFENSSCRAPSDGQRQTGGSLNQAQAGSSLLARDSNSDFTLLRLSQFPAPEWNVYLSGWNATSNGPQNGASIHHPSGDVKMISLYNSAPPRGQRQMPAGPTQTWDVIWSQGTTEQGSSGSGLWDQNHLVVGWLSGGPINACETGPDQYSRMDVAWDSQPAVDQQLKAYLTANGSDTMVLCGRNLGGPACETQPTPGGGDQPSGGGDEKRGGALAWTLLLPLFFFGASRRRIRALFH